MKIEIGINPNCSEATVRFRTDKLTKEQEKELFDTLTSYVDKYGYETSVFRGEIFGIKCVTVSGDAPHNDSDNMMASVKDLKFINRVKTEWEEE